MSINETPEKSNSDSESNSETPIKEEEPSKHLISNDSQLNINNYTYENKDIEALCDKFIENLFLVNPKNYDSFQSHLKIRKFSLDTSRSNLQNSQKKLTMSNNKLNFLIGVKSLLPHLGQQILLSLMKASNFSLLHPSPVSTPLVKSSTSLSALLLLLHFLQSNISIFSFRKFFLRFFCFDFLQFYHFLLSL